MSYVSTIDGDAWRVTWQGITLRIDFANHQAAMAYLKGLS